MIPINHQPSPINHEEMPTLVQTGSQWYFTIDGVEHDYGESESVASVIDEVRKTYPCLTFRVLSNEGDFIAGQ